jgi:hypothetical protein
MSQFKKGDRVVWSANFLANGKKIDPRWYLEQLGRVGTVDWVQRDGDILVMWDDAKHETTIHPPDRLSLYI